MLTLRDRSARFVARLALPGLTLLAPRALGAQWGEPDTLTVSGAVATALANHPALGAAGGRRQAAVGLARQRAAVPNPTVEWRSENLASPLERDVFFTVAQPLDLTGRRLALRAEARAVDSRSAADSVAAARTVATDAARAFWRAGLARGLLDVAVVQRADAQRLADFEQRRAREGAVAELSALRTALEVDRARVAEAAVRAEWSRSLAELARALGVAPSAVPSVPPLRLNAPRSIVLPDAARAEADALGSRPEVLALRAGVDASRRRVSAERRSVLSDVALQAGAKRTAGYATRVVGIAVPFPLFDRNAGARAAAAGELRLAEAELATGERAVRAEVAGAIDALRALLDPAVPRADSLVARAEEVARIADAAYAAGGGSLLELLDARRARADAVAAALRWSTDLRLARLELNRVLGAPLLNALEER
jgi:cobalt-zinc-cadmium efflux system outer membrane protein